MKKILYGYWPATIWSAIIIILLSLPGSAFAEQEPVIPHFDKLVHAGIFGMFVWLWCRFIYLKKPATRLLKTFIYITLLGIVFGYGMELVQKYLVINRDYDWWDVVADAVGCVIGLVFSWYVYIKK